MPHRHKSYKCQCVIVGQTLFSSLIGPCLQYTLLIVYIKVCQLRYCQKVSINVIILEILRIQIKIYPQMSIGTKFNAFYPNKLSQDM